MTSKACMLALLCFAMVSCNWGAKSRQNSVLKPLDAKIADPKLLPGDIRQTAQQKNGTTWVAATNVIARYKPGSATARLYTTKDSLPFIDISHLFIDKKDRVWLTGNAGVALYNPAQDVWTLISGIPPDCHFNLKLAQIEDDILAVDNDIEDTSSVWRYRESASSFDKDFGNLDPGNFLRPLKKGAGSVAVGEDSSIWVLYRGRIWLRRSTDSGFSPTPALPNGAIPRGIFAVGISIIVGDGKQEYLYQKGTTPWKRIEESELERLWTPRRGLAPKELNIVNTLLGNKIESVFLPRHGVGPIVESRTQWNVSESHGCYTSYGMLYERSTTSWKPSLSADRDPIFVAGKPVDIIDTGFQVAISRQGFVGKDPAGNIVTPSDFIGGKLPFQAHNLREVLHDHTGSFWLLSLDGKLFRCKWNTKKCEQIRLPASAGLVLHIAEDPDKKVDIFADKELLRFEPGTDSIVAENSRLNGIRMSAEDDRGGMWLSDGHRIIGWNPRDKLFHVLDFHKTPIFNLSVWPDGELEIISDSGTILLDPVSMQARPLRVADFVGQNTPLNSENKFVSGGRIPGYALESDGTSHVWGSDLSGVLEFTWLPNGMPRRPAVHRSFLLVPALVTAAEADNKKTYIWRTRPLGLSRSGPDGALAFPYVASAAPVTSMSPASDGGVFLGHAGAGVVHYTPEGKTTQITTTQGLPDDGVLDVSSLPQVKTPSAWVGTNAGAALIAGGRVTYTWASPFGPVDKVAALADGGAWVALNPIGDSVFFPSAPIRERKTVLLNQLDSKGKQIGGSLTIPRGTVKSMATGADGKTVWVATTVGLYRIANHQIQESTAQQDALKELSIGTMTVDPSGTVWMGIDGHGETRAKVVGYRPDTNATDNLTTDRGLTSVQQIDSLAADPNGNLLVQAGNSLLSGPVFVPNQGIPLYIYVVGTVLTLTLGAGANLFMRNLSAKKNLTAQYAPLVNLTESFLKAGEKSIRHVDYRTLEAQDVQAKSLARSTIRELVPVEEVIEAFQALPAQPSGRQRRAYLTYPRELDPAARRQLDVYRLRENTVIIPLAVPLMRAKAENGPDAMRVGLDSLERQYLGEQDLFDFRNAIEEPRFFFGRRALLDELVQALNRREHIALIGPRKAGKTSVLNLLQQRLDSFPTVRLDLELFPRSDSRWPEQLLAQILQHYDAWAQARFGNRWATSPIAPDTITGINFREGLLQRNALKNSLGNRQPLVVLLDEIERIFPQNIEDSAAREQIERFNRCAGILRALAQQAGESLLALVFADLHPDFNRVNTFLVAGVDTNPFYRFFQERYVTPLSSEETREMLTEIALAMGLQMDEDVQNRIHEDSGGHAALARQLASRACRMRTGENIGMPEYEKGLNDLLTTGSLDDYYRDNFWQPSTPTERKVLRYIESTNFELTDDALQAQQYLFAIGILEPYGAKYRVRGALFRGWLQQHKEASGAN
jgi:hypothetical protein